MRLDKGKARMILIGRVMVTFRIEGKAIAL